MKNPKKLEYKSRRYVQMTKKSVSFNIDENLKKDLKIFVIKKGITIQEFLEKLVRDEVKRDHRQKKKAEV